MGDDPWPDKYIPVLARPKSELTGLKKDKTAVKIFDNETDALLHAEQLKVKYGAKAVRMFYPDGFSKIITPWTKKKH